MKLTVKKYSVLGDEVVTKSQFMNDMDRELNRTYIFETYENSDLRYMGVKYVCLYNVYYADKLLIEADDQFSTLKEIDETIKRKVRQHKKKEERVNRLCDNMERQGKGLDDFFRALEKSCRSLKIDSSKIIAGAITA